MKKHLFMMTMLFSAASFELSYAMALTGVSYTNRTQLKQLTQEAKNLRDKTFALGRKLDDKNAPLSLISAKDTHDNLRRQLNIVIEKTKLNRLPNDEKASVWRYVIPTNGELERISKKLSRI